MTLIPLLHKAVNVLKIMGYTTHFYSHCVELRSITVKWWVLCIPTWFNKMLWDVNLCEMCKICKSGYDSFAVQPKADHKFFSCCFKLAEYLFTVRQHKYSNDVFGSLHYDLCCVSVHMGCIRILMPSYYVVHKEHVPQHTLLQ